MSERWRLAVEALGACLVILALALVHIALGVFVAGVLLIVGANFYRGDNDDGPE